jgi:hypothetical protein
MKEDIRRQVSLGYKPHHLLIVSGGAVVYDYGRVEEDADFIALAKRFGPK